MPVEAWRQIVVGGFRSRVDSHVSRDSSGIRGNVDRLDSSHRPLRRAACPGRVGSASSSDNVQHRLCRRIPPGAADPGRARTVHHQSRQNPLRRGKPPSIRGRKSVSRVLQRDGHLSAGHAVRDAFPRKPGSGFHSAGGSDPGDFGFGGGDGGYHQLLLNPWGGGVELFGAVRRVLRFAGVESRDDSGGSERRRDNTRSCGGISSEGSERSWSRCKLF
mmetsp:Transcript_18790/g.45250  ORF Transcript_18790/g.45250 Transcript_18790/m.45250 type:complete len:218 (+) Transcript_18790:586-1239(+)